MIRTDSSARQLSRTLAGIVAAVIVLVALTNQPASAASGKTGGVLVVVANRLTIDDIAEHSKSIPILREMAVAAVAPSCIGFRAPESVFASASSGAYSRGDPAYGLLLNSDEPYEAGSAAEAYSRRTGYFPPPSSGIVHVGLASVVGANRRLADPPETWALGKLLRSGKVLRAAFGNSDHDGELWRMGAGLIADDHGLIVRGDVGSNCTVSDDTIPGGLRTNLAWIAPRAASELANQALVTVEFGDLERIESQRGACTPRAYRLARQEACERLFSWVSEMSSKSPGSAVVILSLVPPFSEEERWDALGLAAISSSSHIPGLLMSNTTRTPGIVAAIDVAPTLLELTGVSRQEPLLGYPAYSRASSSSFDEIRRWNLTVALNHDLAFAMIAGLGAVAAAAGCAAVRYLVAPRKDGTLGRIAAAGLAFAVWIPMILLIPLDQSIWYLAIAPLIALSIYAGARLKQSMLAIEIPAAITLFAVFLASVGAIDWLKRSVVTSWQLDGLRFYGIGNEYMGVALGAASVIPLWRFADASRPIPWTALKVWFALWILLLGFPALGADAGGVVAACVLFGLMLRALSGQPIYFRHAALLAAAGVAVAVALAIIDATLSGGAPSHLGMAVEGIAHGRLESLWAMIQRKIVYNFSMWARVETRVALAIYGCVALAGAIYWRQISDRVKLGARLRSGLVAICYGALAALLFNDSGLVSVAFIAAYTMVWMLWDALTAALPGSLAIRRRRADSSR